ncbi:hypothetical protein ACPYO6_14995 [Georgenia sp. Z1344]|uniref:hypothetical protein n=1 Tax=Georgenia sp. Z1344 TaxID=3416706 RepID=UPI003CFB2DE5
MYEDYVSPAFGYMGSTYHTPEYDLYFYSLAICAVTALALPRAISKPSSFVIWVLYIIAGVPSITIGHYSGTVSPVTAMQASIGIGLAFISTCLLLRWFGAPRSLLRWRPSGTTFWILLGVFSSASYLYIAVSVGLRFELVGILDVYDVRDEYRENLTGAGGLAAYLIGWLGNVINPVIMAAGTLQRRLPIVLAGSLGQFVLYSTTGLKTFLLSVPAILIVGWAVGRSSKQRSVLLVWAAAALPVFTMAADRVLGSILFTSLLVRRFLVAPGRITVEYVEFFNVNPRLYLSNSVLSGWVDYPYDGSYMMIIGEKVTGSPGLSMNANVFAHGYANAGWVGVALIVVVLAVVLVSMDYAAHGLRPVIPAMVLLMPAITLSNSGLPTSLLTHGVAVAVVVLALFPRESWAVADMCQSLESSESGPSIGGQWQMGRRRW